MSSETIMTNKVDTKPEFDASDKRSQPSIISSEDETPRTSITDGSTEDEKDYENKGTVISDSPNIFSHGASTLTDSLTNLLTFRHIFLRIYLIKAIARRVFF